GVKGTIYGNSNGLNIEAAGSNDLRLIGGNVVYKTGSDFASNTIVVKTSNFNLPSASSYPNGTVKIILNAGASNISVLWRSGTYAHISPGYTRSFISYGSEWYEN